MATKTEEKTKQNELSLLPYDTVKKLDIIDT